MGRRWLFPVCLIALLCGGGGLLCHTGVVHRISNQDQLIDLLRGAAGPAHCCAAEFRSI